MQTQVQESIGKQPGLVQRITAASAQFEQLTAGQSVGEREGKLKELATGYDSFHQLQSNITEGIKVSWCVSVFSVGCGVWPSLITFSLSLPPTHTSPLLSCHPSSSTTTSLRYWSESRARSVTLSLPDAQRKTTSSSKGDSP